MLVSKSLYYISRLLSSGENEKAILLRLKI